MLRTLASWCVVLAAVIATACGGNGGDAGGTATTVTAEEFARQADQYCSEVAADVAELNVEERGQEILSGSGSQEEKLNAIADLLEEQLQIVSDFREKVEALGTPSTGAEDVDMIIDKTRSAEDELAQAISAARDADEQGFTEAMQRYAGFSAQSASIARESELNFAICGAGA